MIKTIISAIVGVFSMISITSAADIYGELGTDRIWDNLDQSSEYAGLGVTFNPKDRLTIDVGSKYIFNNDLSHSGHIDSSDFDRKSDNVRINHRQLEDEWLLGLSVRYNFISF